MWTRHIRRSFLIAGTLLAALLFFLGGVALRILLGPISLGPLGGAIEDSLNSAVSGLVIRFDQAVIEWSRADGRINLVILGTRVFDHQGHIIAQAPKADIDFDASAMLAGHIVPTRLTLEGVQLTAVRDANGVLHIGFDTAEGGNDLVKVILDSIRSGREQTIEDFAIRDARLAFHDEASGLFVVAPRAALSIGARGGGLRATLDTAIEISGMPAQVTVAADLDANGMPRDATLQLGHLDLAALGANSARFSMLSPVGLTMDIEAHFAFAGDGAIQTISFKASGAGTLGESGGSFVLPVDALHLTGRYDGADRQLRVDDLTISGDHSRAKAIAGLSIAKAANGGVKSVSGTFEARSVYLDVPSVFSAPVALSSFAVSGSYDRDTKVFTLGRASVEGGPLSLSVSGSADFSGEGTPAVSLKGGMAALPVRDLLRYWPMVVGSGARAWVDGHVTDGVVGPANLSADIPAGALDAPALPEDSIALTFPFSAVTTRYIHDLTPLTDAHGHAVLSGDTFQLSLDHANVGTLAVTNGVVDIPNLHLHGAPGDIHAHVEGGMPEILGLINQDPLDYPSRFGIDPATVGGTARVDLDFTVPMLNALRVEDVQIAVKVWAQGLSLPLDADRRMDNGAVSFTITGEGLTSDGTATINGVPVAFKWREDFSGENPITTRVDLTGTIDDSGRRSLGLEGLDWLSGPLRLTATLEGKRVHFERGTLNADLTGAMIDMDMVNWRKPAGVAATLTAAMQFGDAHAITLSDLAFSGEHLDVHGHLSFDGAGTIDNAGFDRVVIGSNNDFSLQFATASDGARTLSLTGRSYDAAGLFGVGAEPKAKTKAEAEESTESKLAQPLKIEATLDKVALRAGGALRDVLLAADFGEKARVDAFALGADGPLKGQLEGKLVRVGDARRLVITADDGGALIAGLTGVTSFRGGTLTLKADFPASADIKPTTPDYTGKLEVKDTVVVNQPFLARLLAIGSLDGPLRLLQGQGIAMSELDVPFSAKGERITITDGRASGPALGLSFDGVVNRRTDRVDLGGSLVPVYGLNSVLGAVPLLGDLLVSKPGEGIIGITYTVRGDIDEPELNVNPLSVLTPGILRRIFDFTAPPAPAPPPLKTPEAAKQPSATDSGGAPDAPASAAPQSAPATPAPAQ